MPAARRLIAMRRSALLNAFGALGQRTEAAHALSSSTSIATFGVTFGSPAPEWPGFFFAPSVPIKLESGANQSEIYCFAILNSSRVSGCSPRSPKWSNSEMERFVEIIKKITDISDQGTGISASTHTPRFHRA